MRPSRRARYLWGLFACLTAVALCLAPLPLMAGFSGWAFLATAGWLASWFLAGQGSQAVRAFEWSADGNWRLQRLDGSWEMAVLTPATVTLGPWLLLAWQAEGPSRRVGRRRYALLDVSEAGEPAFRTLLGRLRLEAGRGTGASTTSPGAYRAVVV